MSDKPIYITPGGYRRLREEYEALFAVERPKLVETISWAAGNGDRSENGDYIYGRKRLREVDRRIGWPRPSSPIAAAPSSARPSPSPTRMTRNAWSHWWARMRPTPMPDG